MAAGEYVSVRAQNDLVARELEKERQALADDPEEETEELAQLYVERGMTIDQAREMAQLVMQNPEMALEVHAREELGIAPDELASPYVAAGWSFSAFAIGALVPPNPLVLLFRELRDLVISSCGCYWSGSHWRNVGLGNGPFGVAWALGTSE